MRAIFLMPAMLAMAAMAAMLGCAGDGAVAREVCRPGNPSVDAAVYQALTRTTWFDQGRCGSGGPLPPTCNRVRLGGDGSYSWTAISDVPERQESGSWNFRARDATSGLVCLGDGSVIDVALTPGGGLRWGPLGELAAETPSSPGAGRAALPVITVDPMFVDLTAHPWAKTNELDLYREPTSFVLGGDGTFDASFRGGACTATGTFSLSREPVAGGTQLTLWTALAARNQCDLRSGGTPAFDLGGETPQLEAGILSLSDASYRDQAIVTDERDLAFSSYDGAAGLTVSATWHGALRAGAQTSWAISLGNDGKAPQQVASLHLDLTPMQLTRDGFIAGGPAVTAVDRALGSTIAPGHPLQLPDVAFTPGPAGWLLLHVEVDSSDSQAYRNQGSFLVELP